MKRWSNISAQHFDDDEKYILIMSQDDGWEVYFDQIDNYFYLYSFRSMVKSQLPQVKEKLNGFSKCIVLSRDDHLNPSPLLVMLIYNDFKTEIHYWCGDEGDDEQWHKGNLICAELSRVRKQALCDVVSFNGKLYGINSFLDLFEILITPGEATGLKPHFRVLYSLSIVWFETARLVVSCNGLFLVVMRTDSKVDVVYKLDVLSSKFTPIYNLGDQVFFIKGNYSTSFPGAKVGHVGDCICVTKQGNELMYTSNLKDGTLSIQVHDCCFNSFREGTPLFSQISHLLCGSNNSGNSSRSSRTTLVTNREAGKEEDGEKSLIMLKIPLHLQEHVAKFVNKGQNYFNFRSVCRSWRSMTPTRQWKIARNEFIECPWLMTIKRYDNGTCELSDPKDNVTYLTIDPELLGCVIRYSKDGWLLVSRDYINLFLYQPFTKEKVRLPELDKTEFAKIPGNGICFSNNPSSSKSSIFFFDFINPVYVYIAYHNPGDRKWTYTTFCFPKPFVATYCNPVFSNGAFYCLSQEGDLGVFKIKDLRWEMISMSTPPVCFPPAAKMIASYLISYNQDIYSVYVSNVAREFVKVYKFGDILLDGGKGEWEEVTSLRNISLFVSATSCSAVVVPESSMQNKIYFPCFSLINNKHVCYSLESGKYHTFDGNGGDATTKGLCDTKELLHCTWIRPSLIANNW